MDSSQLKELARQYRTTRESGVALLIASGILALFLVAGYVFPTTPARTTAVETPKAPDAYANLPTDAKAVIVYDLATGETLYAKNADAQLPLASLTKLLTVYAALTELSPETPVTIPDEATRVDAPRAFNAGQVFSLSDLARLTLTASLNDGAIAIAKTAAERTGQDELHMLAAATAGLALAETYALNGSGLDMSTSVSGGYGSARDLAILAGALVRKDADIAFATTLPTAHATSAGGTSYTVKNTDPMVSTIPDLLLSKTGYTDLAGGNLALVFDAGLGHPIAVIVLGSTKDARFTDGVALVDATLAHFAGVASL